MLLLRTKTKKTTPSLSDETISDFHSLQLFSVVFPRECVFSFLIFENRSVSLCFLFSEINKTKKQCLLRETETIPSVILFFHVKSVAEFVLLLFIAFGIGERRLHLFCLFLFLVSVVFLVYRWHWFFVDARSLFDSLSLSLFWTERVAAASLGLYIIMVW